ncbi:unnamed protein product [Phytophthora lilii]|uniref:Unnamed protein product n=1 Tax=Phytophthora lilii TaxID=2077276 RepID=A0A9W6YKI8_9STRA|nr:unnamed protein product [Phytophthora lilii]
MQLIQFAQLAAFTLSFWSSAAGATSSTSGTIACDQVALASETSSKWTVSCVTEGFATASSAYFDPLLVRDYYVNSAAFVAAAAPDLNLSSTFSEVDALVSPSVTKFSLSAASGPPTPLVVILKTNIDFVTATIRHLEGITLTTIDASSIDLRDNDQMDLLAQTPEHKKQLATWITDGVLLANDTVIAVMDSSNQKERSSVVDSADTDSRSTTRLPSSSSGSVSSTRDNGNMDEIPITIIAVVVPAVLAIGITLAFVVRKRRRMQYRETDGILDLPHPFGKPSRDRTETSGNFTSIESELSRESNHQDANDRGSCVDLAVTPSDAYAQPDKQPDTSTSASGGYVNLKSPQDSPHNFLITNTRRHNPDYEYGDTRHSLEMLSTHSTSSATPAQPRTAARKALRLALESLVEPKLSEDGSSTAASIIVNANQYSFSPRTEIEETALAFFVSCHLSEYRNDVSSELAPHIKLGLKIFIEDDADLAGRESYALSCLQHDDSSRAFAPRLHDTALEYELVLPNTKNTRDAVTLNCSILVLESPSCTSLQAHIRSSREPLAQTISRVVQSLRSLHARGLVHGALHTDSLIACFPDARLKFWGLEHASRDGHKVPCPDTDLLGITEAEYVAPELAALALEDKPNSRAAPSLDVWSLGVIILKIYAYGQQLGEFQGCSHPHDVFERLNSSDLDGELLNECFFERSITQFVSNEDVKILLRQCLQRTPTLRLSVDEIAKHKIFFQAKEREVSRTTTVKSAVVSRMLSAIIEEKDVATCGEPEREASGKEHVPEKIENKLFEQTGNDFDTVPEPLPPSLWLFLPPVELEIDLTQRASYYTVEQWVSQLKRLQQQRGEELRFPLVFMCETCEASAAVPCSIATTTKSGTSVTSSLLPLVMPLVQETMLFLEARTLLSDGRNVGEASGLAGPQQWEELRTFYRALERMELATLNPVNEVELAPMEQALKDKDPARSQQVLDKLTQLIFSGDKREYVRNLLDALVGDEVLANQMERSSWTALRRCDETGGSPSTSGDRWLGMMPRHVPEVVGADVVSSTHVVNADDVVPSLISQTDDVADLDKDQILHPSPAGKARSPRVSSLMPKLSRASSSEPRPSVVNIISAEVATFYDVFGVLGVPMIIMFVVSAAWTFMMAAIQLHADSIANTIMNTTDFDNGDFWLLPKADSSVIVSAVVLLTLFGIGYTALAVTMIFFYRAGAPVESDLAEGEGGNTLPSAKRMEKDQVAQFAEPSQNIVRRAMLWIRKLPSDVRDHYFVMFAPLVVLIYYINTFEFDRAEFITRTQTLSPGTFDNVARIFGEPSQISSFCSAFHYLQFSLGSTLFYKSSLNLLSLYKWRKIIVTLIRNYHERKMERKRKALIKPVATVITKAATIKAVITEKLSVSMRKPKLGRHFFPKLVLSLGFLAVGIYNFVYSIGSVVSTTELCSKHDKCVLTSYSWNFGHKHCTCLVFADRQTSPKTYAEWTDPEDTTENLAELAIAGELRIIQIINRAVPELPEELRKCHNLEQLILAYTKTNHLPEWISEFSHMELLTIADGIFDNMEHLAFLHLGTHPDVKTLPSLASLKNVRYLTVAVLDSLTELPSFHGLKSVSDLNIVSLPSVASLPSLAPLKSLKNMVIRARSAVCCNGFISGTCNMIESQCMPILGERHPLICTDKRISAEDKEILTAFGNRICPPSVPLARELTAPSIHSTDELCGGTKYKECAVNGVQGMCYNTRMTVINCETTSNYINMRKLQIKRGVGDVCDPDVEAWLGCVRS